MNKVFCPHCEEELTKVEQTVTGVIYRVWGINENGTLEEILEEDTEADGEELNEFNCCKCGTILSNELVNKLGY